MFLYHHYLVLRAGHIQSTNSLKHRLIILLRKRRFTLDPFIHFGIQVSPEILRTPRLLKIPFPL